MGSAADHQFSDRRTSRTMSQARELPPKNRQASLQSHRRSAPSRYAVALVHQSRTARTHVKSMAEGRSLRDWCRPWPGES